MFVPGLTDGPMSLSYLPRLAEALADADARRRTFRLCQPVLSSSYLGFGVSSLRRDCEELDDVIRGVGPAPGRRQRRHPRRAQHGVPGRGRVLRARRARLPPPRDHPPGARERPRGDGDGRRRGRDRSRVRDGGVARRRGARRPPMPRGAGASPAHHRRAVREPERRMGEDDMFSSDLTDAELEAKLRASPSSASRDARRLAGDQHVPPRQKRLRRAEARLFRAAGGNGARASSRGRKGTTRSRGGRGTVRAGRVPVHRRAVRRRRRRVKRAR